MFNFRRLVFLPFFLLFFGHGFLYYFFPQYHYTEGSGGGWISYIKYLCLIVLLPFLVYFKFGKKTAAWVSVGFALFALTLPSSVFWGSDFNFLLIQYQIPMLAYFFAGNILKYFSSGALLRGSIFFLLIVIAFALVVEFFSGGLIGDYSRGGIRAVGPFVNPNNTGIVVALLAAIFHYSECRALRNLVVALASLLVLVLTGSKTALLMYFVCLMLVRGGYWRFFLLLLIGCLLIIFFDRLVLYWDALELRAFSAESGSIRIDDASAAFAGVFSGSVGNMLFGTSIVSIVDNAYLDMLLYGGLALLIPFVMIQFASVFICIRYNYGLMLLLHMMIFLAMLTTNIPRLWPVGYIYWAMVGLSFFKVMRATQSHSSSNANNLRKSY